LPESIFLTAEWRYLAMLNYQVDPVLLRDLVPPGTELDAHDGRVFVSLVGFRFLRTRVLGAPIPFHQDFDEVNLRFYVRRVHNGEVRRGVVFVREIVPKFAIAAVARVVYNEKYVSRPMFHSIVDNPEKIVVEYGWREDDDENRMRVECAGHPAAAEEGSVEQFITEHYWGYTTTRSSGCDEYQVEHPPWRLWTAQRAEFLGDTADLYGPDLAKVLERPPDSALLADGSAIIVRSGSGLALTES